MADDTEGRDPEGTHREAQPGGSPSRGPNADPGGEVEPGGLVPPYEGRTTGSDSPSSSALAESVERQLAETKTGRPGETASPADEQPVREDEVTDEVPDSPKGVGQSANRRGEDMGDHHGKEPGREDAGTKGQAERPVGKSDERDASAVDPQGSQGDAPNVGTGDQGG